jgi:hypothetical protein
VLNELNMFDDAAARYAAWSKFVTQIDEFFVPRNFVGTNAARLGSKEPVSTRSKAASDEDHSLVTSITKRDSQARKRRPMPGSGDLSRLWAPPRSRNSPTNNGRGDRLPKRAQARGRLAQPRRGEKKIGKVCTHRFSARGSKGVVLGARGAMEASERASWEC